MKAIDNNQISNEFVSEKSTKKVVWQVSTGSDGKPFLYPNNMNSENHRNAARRRLYNWYGLGYGTKWAHFWRGKYKKSFYSLLKESLTKRYSFCIYDPEYPKETELNAARIKFFIDKLNRIKPTIIDGFPSALYEIGNYMKENDVNLNYNVRAVVTGAEVLNDDTRKLISEVFNAPVYNRYGGTESSIIAHECTFQTESNHYLHIQEDRLIVETDDNDEIILTDLNTKSIPFIRYKNGDMATINDNYYCPCKRQLKIISNIQGRVNDMFILPNGNKITSHLWQTYMKKTPSIANYRMVQEEDFSVKIYWIRKKNTFDDISFSYVQGLVYEALKGCDIKWIEKSNFKRGIGGKFRQHISNAKIHK